MTQNLEVLVIEDNDKHLNDAKAFFGAQQGVNVTYASTFREALEKLGDHRYDGVITDLFFPTGYEGSVEERSVSKNGILRSRSALRIIEEGPKSSDIYREDGTQDECKTQYVIEHSKKLGDLYDAVSQGRTLPPLGILVLDSADNTPIIVCTSDSNHAVGVQETAEYRRKKGDSTNSVVSGTNETGGKCWPDAYGILLKSIELGSVAKGVEAYYE